MQGFSTWISASGVMLVGLGTFLLAYTLRGMLGFFPALSLVPARDRRWLRMRLKLATWLAGTFLVVYLSVLCTQLTGCLVANELMTGMVLFWGAAFVHVSGMLHARMLKALRSTIEGLVPICAACKKIRAGDSERTWESVESYVQSRTDATFTHSVCPDCAKRLYPELSEDDGPADAGDTSTSGVRHEPMLVE